MGKGWRGGKRITNEHGKGRLSAWLELSRPTAWSLVVIEGALVASQARGKTLGPLQALCGVDCEAKYLHLEYVREKVDEIEVRHRGEQIVRI